MKQLFITFLILSVLAGLYSVRAENSRSNSLPHRSELAGEVKFWKQIFTRVSVDEYVLHDADNLRIIYKTVRFDSSVSERRRERALKVMKEEIRDLLLRFQNVSPDSLKLSEWEAAVYHQFDAIRAPDKFLQASKRVRAQQGIREQFMAGITRSFAYLPFLEKTFEQNGLPRALVYLPHVESSFNPEARSHVGATGMWQFMRRTARRFMKINRIKDERYDPLVSTRAAARLLKHNYEKLNDWALAITAYNHGLAGMMRAQQQFGGYLNIREQYLRRSFGFASKNFYPEFLAVVEIADSVDHYFPGIAKEPSLVFQEFSLPASVNLRRFAAQFGIDPETLQRFNPGFHRLVWSGARSVPAGYTVRLPLEVDVQPILAALGGTPQQFQQVRLIKPASHGNAVVITSPLAILQRSTNAARLLQERRPNVHDDRRPEVAVTFAEELFMLPEPPAGQLPHLTDASVAPAADPSAVLAVLPRPSVEGDPQPPQLLIALAAKAEASAAEAGSAGQRYSVSHRRAEVIFSKAGEQPEAGSPLLAAAAAAYFPELAAEAIPIRKESYRRPLPLQLSRVGVEEEWTGDIPPAVLDDRQYLLAFGLTDHPPEETVPQIFREWPQWGKAGVADELLAVNDPRQYQIPAGSGMDAREQPLAAVEATTPITPGNAYGPIFADVTFSFTIAINAREMSPQELFTLLVQRLNPVDEAILIYPGETLGHFSDWLQVDINRLRRLNNLGAQSRLNTGQKLLLDFSRITPAEFLMKRLSYHLRLINRYLEGHSRIELVDYKVRRGESFWDIARKSRNFPVNLLLYFNELDKLEQLYPGDIIKLPIIS